MEIDHNKKNVTEQEQQEQHTAEEERAGMLEKVFTAVSLILLLLMTGYLIKESFVSQTQPSFELKSSDPIKRGKYKAIDIYVENSGDRAAKAVNIKGEIAGEDGKPAEAEATIDWLPGHSTRKATLVFPADVPTTEPKLEIVGYEDP